MFGKRAVVILPVRLQNAPSPAITKQVLLRKRNNHIGVKVLPAKVM